MARTLLSVSAVAAAVLFGSVGRAAADSNPPSPPSPADAWAAAAQYVEMIPTSTGPKPAGTAATRAPLPTALATQLTRRGGADAAALKTLVTSSGWGAPTGRPRAARPQQPKAKAGRILAVPSPQQSPSLAGAVGGGGLSGSSRAIFALVALLVMLSGFALVRMRRGRRR